MLAERVTVFLNERSLRRRVAEAGVEYVRRHHDADVMADHYDALLRSAA
jgi:hypothetical protein